MTRPVLLDLFCGAGGAAVGYHRAGFEVIGVDIRPQPRYPFTFVQADALVHLREWAAGHPGGAAFDAVHASPPCQAFSVGAHGYAWPDLITPVRELLRKIGVPWVIENVPGAPLTGVTLCGTQFPELRVLRHRVFETSDDVVVPELPHASPHPLTYTTRRNTWLDPATRYVQVTGGGNTTLAEAKAAMGVDWDVLKVELNEMIPPAYAEYVGRFLLAAVNGD